MSKFEYRLLDTKSGFFSGSDYKQLTEHLHLLGGQGWEVVAVVGTSFRRWGHHRFAGHPQARNQLADL